LSQPRLERLKVPAVSVLIAGLLVLQGMASFSITPGPMEPAPWGWPFLDYPMYNHPKYPGQPLERHVVFAILADSTEAVIEPTDLNVTYFQFANGLNPAIRSGDRVRAQAYRDLYERRFGRELIGFRLEYHPLHITPDGLREGVSAAQGSLYFDGEPPPP